ncbi:cobalt ECF transporter T component CbiQ [Nocardioides sp. SYSU DS0651]|uniref:cobalt ECF transporter T component CbiQ n=1 Tax=Nocardioides sp. SYSU DS0651 TaxID=3415955 RepID=UPI003F4BCB6B
MRPEHRILLLLAFVLVVVATPREWFPVFGGYLTLVLGVAAAARVSFRRLARGTVIEVPFLVFAAMMPFVVRGPEVEVLGVGLSEPGLLAAWGLAAKGTLGVLASLTLAATTEPVAVLTGLQRLRVPDLIVQIMGFMIRYLSVVAGDLQRMLTAMRSRGVDPRSPRHWPALARTLGALFVRSYERGERVHLAMLSRGYDGRLPERAT